MKDKFVEIDETVDDLIDGELKIIQRRNGYRFSLDPVLLCNFTRIPKKANIIDLGTGCGIIPLLISKMAPGSTIVGLEIQESMADRARRSVHLNSLNAQVEICAGDVRQIKQLYSAESFDLVMINPPYRTPQSGKLSSGDERAAARHELCGGLNDFLKAASFLLPSGRSVCMVFLAERMSELLSAMESNRLEPKRLRMVYSRQGDVARLVMVEGCKNAQVGVVVEPPLYIYDGDRYSQEIIQMYKLPSAGIDGPAN